MGKQDENDELYLAAVAANDSANGNGSNADRRECSWLICRLIKLRCLLALLLGISVFLSAVFWLPPFLNFADRGDSDLDPRYRGHTIVATFNLLKPVSILEDNVEELEADIFEVFGVTNSKVIILSVESTRLNTTNIVFAIDHVPKHSIPSAPLSLIRSTFVSLVIRQTTLQLGNGSLFGVPSFFEVLKFPGGITVSPPQIVYPLQKVQILFNFTLNYSILQIQENFEVLGNQLATGLRLTANENLYIRLTNSRGSTLAPPATVQTSVVLKVGVPSKPRLKQLAQTIRDSPARNLGLNNTVFGKVKQVSLSSVLQHSLGDAASPTPAPAPAPFPHHHHHHHHHHHYHHHHHDSHGANLPPASAPSYSPVQAPQPVKGSPPLHRSAPPPVKHGRGFPSFAPAPAKSYQATPPGAHPPVKSYQASPPGCRFKFRSRHFGKSPEHSPGIVTRAPSIPPHPTVAAPPHPQAKPPTPVAHRISPSSPLPNVIYARDHPPSASEMDPEPPDKMPPISPSQSAGVHITATHWVLSLIVVLLLHNCC